MLKFERGPEDLAISEEDYRFVAEQLGREPRGLEAIQIRRSNTKPVVIRVSSLVDGKPFPTLFWLVDPELSYQIDQLESRGLIAHLQNIVDSDNEKQHSMKCEHIAYIAMRERYLPHDIHTALVKEGFADALSKKGIGGLGNFTRIRCLHTWYAAHLVSPNTIGQLMERETT